MRVAAARGVLHLPSFPDQFGGESCCDLVRMTKRITAYRHGLDLVPIARDLDSYTVKRVLQRGKIDLGRIVLVRGSLSYPAPPIFEMANDFQVLEQVVVAKVNIAIVQSPDVEQNPKHADVKARSGNPEQCQFVSGQGGRLGRGGRDGCPCSPPGHDLLKKYENYRDQHPSSRRENVVRDVGCLPFPGE